MEKQRSVHNIRPETNYTMMIFRPLLFDFQTETNYTMMIFRPLLFDFQTNALLLYDN